MVTMTVSKSDCVTLKEAYEMLGISRSTFYNYSNYLGIEKKKFPFDPKGYVLKVDVERIKALAEQSKE
jgi:Response regulator containing CheY-like receiver, AAA-type ATPase, and DNA-binding domains